MQVLWSRAQARAACRCGSCLHAAIARRTTTAAGRRRLKVSDIFTACYSTILATAAFADAKVKEDRRKEWDRVIAEAKAGIPQVEPEYVEETRPQPTSNSPGRISSSDGNLQAQTSLFKPSGVGDCWTAPLRDQGTSLESKLRILDSQLRVVSTSSRSIAEQESIELTSPDINPDNEWVEEEWDRELPPREPRCELHLRKMEEMVAKLVDRLLLQTSIYSVENFATTGSNDIREQMNEMAQRIETLRTGFTRLPAYSWDDMESVQEQRTALHRSLIALCLRTTPSKPNIDLMLAKICYNLLISTAPPSIFTYNTLLREFNRLRQPYLSQIVIDSYFYESKLKLTKTTGRLILDHYRIKQDPHGFSTVSKRMSGHDKSMRIKRRHIDNLWMYRVQEWAMTNKVIHRGAHIYQKMPRGAAIFDSLICGSLEMKGIRCAVRYVRAAFQEGFEITSETLCNVIKACLGKFDRLAGISLLRAMLWWTANYDIPETFYSKTVRAHVYRLLSLCGINPSLGSHQRLPLGLPGDLLEQMLRHMTIESITDSVDRFGKRIMSLEYVFCASETGSSTSLDWVTQALILLERADGWDKIRAKRKRQGNREGRWTKLRTLESMLAMHANKIQARQVELLPLAFARLTPEQKNQYLESIRILEQGGQVVETSARVERLSRFVRMQNQGGIPKVEEPPRTVLKKKKKKKPKKGKSLPAMDIIEPQQSSILIPAFSVSEPGTQTTTV